jgi:hypothetical protein
VSRALAKLARSLADRRAPDGGFPALPGGSPDSESTALAALAQRPLAADAAREAVHWLAARQRADGAWPLTDAVPEASWASAWVVIALARADQTGAEPLARAATWLVAREGRRPGLAARALARLTGQHQRLEQDRSLRGWPWHESAASWVEPTAGALLALRVLQERVDVPGARERIEEGERLLWDRVCVNGGWNYGNRRVLGEALEPFPDTTAFALLALQGSARSEALAGSCEALDRLLDERASSLGLALGTLAFELHARAAAPLRQRLEAHVECHGPPHETRSIAFALLALAGGAALLQVGSR